ncbi:universal stress protein [Paeniglutamicibacter sp.]|uniref:universal stress protein n=1 Tax=Paeniglutamicibacter sp. TaxID=1934391 RepID=UPI003989166D
MRLGSGISRIVVGVDGSYASLEALRHAQYLAGSLNAHIEAISCWDYPRMYDSYILAGIEGFKEGAEKVLNQAITSVFGTDTPSNLTVSLVQGDPRSVLIKAGRNADLLIVGRKGHGMLTGLLTGSVSSFCIAHATCPVLVAPTPDNAENE